MNNNFRHSCVLIAACIVVVLSTPGCREISSPRLPAPADRDEAWTQDLEYLLEDYPRYNKSFTGESMARFETSLNGTIKDISSLSDNEIYVAIMGAAATAGEGHASVNLFPSAQKLRRLPIRFYWFSEGLYVIKATEEYESLLGARVVAINNQEPESLVQQMAELVAGNNTVLRYESTYYLSSPDFLQGLGVISDPGQVPIEFEMPDASDRTVDFAPMPMGDSFYGYRIWSELSPLSTLNLDAEGMIHLLEGGTVPPYLAAPDVSCSLEYLAETDLLYLQINQNTNMNIKMKDFTKEVEKIFADTDVERVVVDLRFNTGGNLLLTGDLVKGIPEWHTGSGKIYIIIGGPTFSAGIVSAARLKYYAGERAVIVGEPAAEGLQFWAESRFFVLPNSGITVFAPQAYHNWEDGSYDRDKKHFWLMKQVGIPAGDLDVDIPASVSFKDYTAGRDSIMDRIVNGN